MAEVKRYHLTETGLVEGESLGRLSVVLSSDFDTLQSRLDDTERQRRAEFDAGQAAERLAAELQQRLTAADERSDVLEGLLRTSLIAMKRIYQAGYDRIIAAGGTCDTPEYMMESDPTVREIRAALKPAEGGGDESAHDRAYRNGLMQGYNLANNGSEKEYQDAVARYSGGKDAE